MKRRISEFAADITVNIDTILQAPGKILAWAALSIIVLFVFYSIRSNGLTDINAMNQGQIALNISKGKGFTTNFICPRSLVDHPQINDHPELFTPPLYAYILSKAFNMFGATDRVVILVSVLFYVASIPMFFIIAVLLFNKQTATLALLLYITNPIILGYSISGTSMPLLIFLFMLLIAALYSLDERSLIRSIAAGLILGLCFLADYSYALLYLATVIYICASLKWTKRLIRHIVYMTLSFLIVIAPWLCRLYIITGKPFFTYDILYSVMFTDLYPGNYIIRSTGDFSVSFLTLVMILSKKLFYGSLRMYDNLLFLTSNYLMPFFILSAFIKPDKCETLRVRNYLYLSLFLLFIFTAIYFPGKNILTPLMPLIIIVATNYFIVFMLHGDYFNKTKQIEKFKLFLRTDEKYKRIQQIIILVLFISINTYPLFTSFILGGRGPKLYPKDRMRSVKLLTDPNETVITDIPWAVAWHCDRKAVWIPCNDRDYARIINITGNDRCLYLSPIMNTLLAAEPIQLWKTVCKTHEIPGDVYLRSSEVIESGGLFISKDYRSDRLEQKEPENIFSQL